MKINVPVFKLSDLIDRTVTIKAVSEKDSDVILIIAFDVQTVETFVLDCSTLH